MGPNSSHSSTIFLVLFAYLALCTSLLKAEPQVTSPAGTFQGAELTAPNGQPYLAFKGIPYAQPPLGDLRFKKPQPVGKHDGVYDATEFKPYCIQLYVVEVGDFEDGQEDCLYLNIYAPVRAGEKQDNLKKIFFFIHGGGNMNGFSNVYGGGTLATTQDVIVITLNYRLGVLGFLTTGSPACRGNFGMWDQVEALKWVKANIQAFGGDPNGITISGESAGAVDVSFLALSTESADLFQGAFPMSGVAGVESGSLPAPSPVPFVATLAKREKCLQADQPDPASEEELEKVIDCLRNVPADKFSNADGLGGIPPLTAIIDGDLIPKAPIHLFADPEYLDSIKFTQRKYMVGFNYNEGAIFDIINEDMMKKIPEEQRSHIPPEAMFHGTIGMFLSGSYGQVSDEVVMKVAEYYTKNHVHSPTSEFASDAVFQIPSLEYLNATSRTFPAGKSQAYLFRFVNFPEYLTGKFKGTVHGLDLLYLFDCDLTSVNKIIPVNMDHTKWNEKDDALKVKYTNMVGAFIKTGNPGKGVSEDLPSGWPAYDPEGGHYLVFGDTPKVAQHFQPERSRLWREQIPAWVKEFPADAPEIELDVPEDMKEKTEL